MAISYINSGSGGFYNMSSANIAVPSGLQTNDVLIAAVGTYALPGINIPTNWTQIFNGGRFAVFTKLFAGETGNYNFTLGATGDGAIALAAYRGVSTTPVDVQGQATNTNVAPSITTTVANDWLVTFFFSNTLGTSSIAQPGGETKRATGITPGGDSMVIVSDESLSSAGATGTRTCTPTPTTSCAFAFAVALKPPTAARRRFILCN